MASLSTRSSYLNKKELSLMHSAYMRGTRQQLAFGT
jgi:hypothetical protein